MKNYFTSIAFVCLITCTAIAQQPAAILPNNTQPITKTRILQVDSAVVTKHQVTIKGKLIPYTATAGCLPIWDDDARPVAGLFYTYYERDDVTDRASRPLVISFNGGPGTPSVWM